MQPTGTPGLPRAYPARLAIDPSEQVANWRPLVHWFLAVPHWLVLYALQLVSQLLAVVSWFVVVFTGSLPQGLAEVQTMYLRYYARVLAYVAFLHEDYPPFSFPTEPHDPGTVPRVRVDVDPVLTERDRLTTAFRIILFLPHAVALAALGVAAAVLTLISAFAVLFTGRWPEGFREFVVGYGRWWTRANSYVLLLHDEYPPFALE